MTRNVTRLLISALLLFAGASAIADPRLFFVPDEIALSDGESQVVQIWVADVPADGVPGPGLTTFDIDLEFDPGTAIVEDPNIPVSDTFGVSLPFQPLSLAFCNFAGRTCPDPEWFLTSTGRSPQDLLFETDPSDGEIMFGYASQGSQAAPAGEGVLALIKVTSVDGGSGRVTFGALTLLGDSQPVTAPYNVLFGELVINPPSTITVPNVVGLSQAQAETDIGDAGLTVGTITGEFSLTVPAGDVIRQDPAAGTDVAPGSPVDLFVSLGLPPEAPVIAPIGDRSVDEGGTIVIDVSASDGNGDAITLSPTGLPSFCSFTDANDGTGSFACAPGFDDANTYTIGVTATDNSAGNLSSNTSFTLTVNNVNRAPVLGALPLVSVNENATVSITIDASDPDGDNLSFEFELPTYCVSTMAAPTINCAPDFGDSGDVTITVVVTDDGSPQLSDSGSFTLSVVDVNQPPVLDPIGNQTVDEGATLTIGLTASDADGDTVAYSTTGLPGFCTLTDNGDGTGSIDCAPDFDNAGAFTVTVTVTDDDTPPLDDSETFTLTVVDVNQAPTLDVIGNQSVDEGATLTIGLGASDSDGNTLAFGTTGLPGFCTLNDNGDGTGSIDCAPDFDNAGAFTVTVTVTDDGTPPLEDSETFTLTVVDVNQAPALDVIGNQSVDEGATLTIGLGASDSDGNTLAFGTTGLPGFCTLTDNGDGTGSIDCAPDFDNAGAFTVTVTVTDDGTPPLEDSETLTLTVVDVNQAPALDVIGNQSVDEGATLTIGLGASDSDGNTLAFGTTGLPGFCTLTDNGDGTGSIDCAPDFDNAGAFTVTVTVTDDGTPPLEDSETFTLTVNDVNRAPELDPIGNQSVDEGATLTIGLGASDSDGNTLAFGTTGLPGFCTLTDNGDGTGSIDCVPDFDNAGAFTVTVTVTDDGTPAEIDSETFTLTVADVNRAPDLGPIADQTMDEGDTLTVPLVASDPDGDNLTLTVVNLPAFGLLVDNGDGTGSLSFAPGFNDAGVFTITLTATDDGTPNRDDSESFTLVVQGMNRAPVVDPIADVAVDEDATITIPVSSTDPDAGDALTLSLSAPGFCVLTDNGDGSGAVDCAPGFSDAGGYGVVVTATDNGVPPLQGTASFNLVVVDVNRAPDLAPVADQTVEEGASAQFVLNAVDPDGDALTLTFSAPVFCTLTDNGNGNGTVDCAPADGDAGTYPISATVTDSGTGNLSDTENFELTVVDAVVIVPSVVGLPLGVAESDILAAGLNPVVVAEEVSDTVAKGSVISQDPAGGAQAQTGDDVNLVVSIGQPPNAVIAPLGMIEVGLTADLDGSASDDPDGDLIVSYSWLLLSAPPGSALPAIQNANQPMASFTPDVAGAYLIELTVSDGGLAGSATDTLIAEEPALPPTANAGGDQTVNVFGVVTLDGSASAEGDGSTDELDYLWAFDSVAPGSSLDSDDIGDRNMAIATFIPDVAGDFVVTLTVTDPIDSDADTVTITAVADNVPPIADAGPDQLFTLNGAVTVDAGGSSDPDFGPGPLTFEWSFVSVPAGLPPIQNADQPIASFIPDVVGQYVLQVAVSDTEEIAFDNVAIIVGVPPEAPDGLVGRAKLNNVNLGWTPSDGADNYRVFRRLDAEVDFVEIGATEFAAFVDDLPAGTLSAEYFVVAENQFGASAESEIVTVVPTSRRRR